MLRTSYLYHRRRRNFSCRTQMDLAKKNRPVEQDQDTSVYGQNVWMHKALARFNLNWCLNSHLKAVTSAVFKCQSLSTLLGMYSSHSELQIQEEIRLHPFFLDHPSSCYLVSNQGHCLPWQSPLSYSRDQDTSLYAFESCSPLRNVFPIWSSFMGTHTGNAISC